MRTLAALIAVLALMSAAYGHANYTGYSGAPGTQGICSISCHHQRDFAPTMRVTGFPGSYVPGSQYVILVSHISNSSIRNFNASVRQGTSSNNAGVIAAGMNTSTYSVSQETNGVHWTTSIHDSGSFVWTAPPTGTGTVRLYWAGLQGSLNPGADTAIVLLSNESSTGIDEGIMMPGEFALAQNYPNPFNGETVIGFDLPGSGPVELSILNVIGQKVFSWSKYIDTPGKVMVTWSGKTSDGLELSSGLYFYQLQTQDGRKTRQMVFLK